MSNPRRLIVTAATATIAVIAPLTLAESAHASAPAFSVAVEHCSGGVSIARYPSLVKATKAQARLVASQLHHPGTLRSVQLRKGTKLIKASTKHCPTGNANLG